MRLTAVLLAAAVLCHLAAAEEAAKEVRARKMKLIKKFLKKKLPQGHIRLVEGHEKNEGNVEIFHKNSWGNICDDEWDTREADVVCRQLGFEKGARIATHSSRYGPARRKFWMDNLYCNGDESLLSKCRFDGWGISDCDSSEAAGVVCHPNQEEATPVPTKAPKVLKPIEKSIKQPLKLRLTGGRIPDEGRVEVKFSPTGEWGVLCGDGWGLPEAAVVCRQLGLGFANAAIQTDFFGGRYSKETNKTTPMVLSGVECKGSEASIDACLHHQINEVDCPGESENIAAVVCTQAVADLVIDHHELMRSSHLEDRQLFFLQCAMEENCLGSQAYKIRDENENWHLDTRRLLRFTATIHNSGSDDFRPFVPKHLWQFHQCHMHYHSMEVFATFDVFDSTGRKVAEGHKASFCLEDNQCKPGVKPAYACANYGDQGISVGCSDIYKHNIDCQWVDISELKPGLYTFKVAVNPEFKVAEQSFENNAALCNLLYTESYAHVFNCTLQRP